jgi:hypothetical protein
LLLRQGCRSSQLKKPTGLFLNAVHLASKAHSLLLFLNLLLEKSGDDFPSHNLTIKPWSSYLLTCCCCDKDVAVRS